MQQALRKKVCILGAAAVGKTSLVAGISGEALCSTYRSTLGVRITTAAVPVSERLRELIRDLGVSVEILFADLPNGSPDGPLYEAIESALLAIHPEAAVTPYMSTGFTDSRFYRGIGIPTYGLMPMVLPLSEHGKIHGIDERIPLACLSEMTDVVYMIICEWNQA